MSLAMLEQYSMAPQSRLRGIVDDIENALALLEAAAVRLVAEQERVDRAIERLPSTSTATGNRVAATARDAFLAMRTAIEHAASALETGDRTSCEAARQQADHGDRLLDAAEGAIEDAQCTCPLQA